MRILKLNFFIIYLLIVTCLALTCIMLISLVNKQIDDNSNNYTSDLPYYQNQDNFQQTLNKYILISEDIIIFEEAEGNIDSTASTIKFSIDYNYYFFLNIGMQLDVNYSTYNNNGTFSATLESVNDEVIANKVYFTASFDNSELNLPKHFSVSTSIFIEERRNVVLIPKEFVYNNNYVYKVQDYNDTSETHEEVRINIIGEYYGKYLFKGNVFEGDTLVQIGDSND